MSYVNKTLMPNEQVLYQAKIHWIIYFPGLLLLLTAAYFFGMEPPASEEILAPVWGSLAAVLGVFNLLKALIAQFSTEMAVTTKRVIAKTGFVRRSTIELNHSKLESISVEQSIPGRIFGFGTLVLNGTGGGKTPIPNIDSPLDFRKEAMQAADPV